MAGPVGLSMGALPLHWQPGDFHFGGGGLGGSFQTTFPYNSHCLPLQRSLVPRSREPKFNDVYVWGTSQDLASPSLVETLCFCDCRPSSSIKGALNAFLPLACSTFIFPPRTARGNSKKKKTLPQSSCGLVQTCFFCKYIIQFWMLTFCQTAHFWFKELKLTEEVRNVTIFSPCLLLA